MKHITLYVHEIGITIYFKDLIFNLCLKKYETMRKIVWKL